MSVPVEAEILCKAAQYVLRRDINAVIDQITLEWASPQAIGTITLPADPLPGFTHFQAVDIALGRVDAVASISNFPSIQIFTNTEEPDPAEGGEQNFTGVRVRWVVRLVVQGVTPEHTEKLISRYKDAAYRAIMSDRNLGGAVTTTRPPDVEYASVPALPLYRAVQLTFDSAALEAW